MKFLIQLSFLLIGLSIFAQKNVDGNFPFQNNSAKIYALYEPSGYSPATPIPVMLAFHPFNPGVWSGFTWRNELRDFAEENDLLLVCPDGGSNGRIDDPIDYDFTSALLDSVKKWYTVNEDKVFALGFSVGGKALYEYGLSHPDDFAGFMPIGAAIDGTSEVNDVLQNAFCKPFYLVHGENDAVSQRFDPIKAALLQNKAEVNFILMAGVGHTFNFPNRESILKSAYRWMDTVKCKTATGIESASGVQGIKIWPNLVDLQQGEVTFSMNQKPAFPLRIEVVDLNGRSVLSETIALANLSHTLSLKDRPAGMYVVRIWTGRSFFSQRIVLY